MVASSSSFCPNQTPSTSAGVPPLSFDPVKTLRRAQTRLMKAKRLQSERCLPYDAHVRLSYLEKRLDENNDEDLQFLKSLLPYLKVFDMMRKMKLRTKIQELICSEMENAKREENPATMLEDVLSPCVILKQEPPDSGSNDA